jgi:hypothetical protein
VAGAPNIKLFPFLDLDHGLSLGFVFWLRALSR